jgi:hypothetical protein
LAIADHTPGSAIETRHARIIMQSNLVDLLCELTDILYQGFQDDPDMMTDKHYTRTYADIFCTFNLWGGTDMHSQTVIGELFFPRLCRFLDTRDKNNTKLTKERRWKPR